MGRKGYNNKYHNFYDTQEHHSHLDDEQTHDYMLALSDQTWYFAIADCDGKLEVFTDNHKRDHLLGLSELWEDIEEEQFAGFETSNSDMKAKRKEFEMVGYSGEASLEETQLMREIKDTNEMDYRRQNLQRKLDEDTDEPDDEPEE